MRENGCYRFSDNEAACDEGPVEKQREGPQIHQIFMSMERQLMVNY